MPKSLLSYRDLFYQLMRFSMTGATAASVHYFVVVIIVEIFKLDPLWVNVIGFGSGFIISFFGHRYWTFADSNRHIMIGLPMFLVVAGINFGINQSLFYLFLRIFNLQYYFALLIVLCIMALITFLLSKLWVFRH